MQTPDQKNPPAPQDDSARRSVLAALKLFALGVLVFVLWIPLQLVHGIVSQRQARQVQVEQEIAASWGGQQSLRGPILVLRYGCVEEALRRERCDGVRSRKLFVHPETTHWRGSVSAQTRSRSLFDAVVWQTELQAEVDFPPVAEELERDDRRWRLEAAGVAVSVSDEVGLTERSRLDVSGKPVEMTVGALPGFDAPTLVGTVPFEPSVDGQDMRRQVLDGLGAQVSVGLRGTRRLAFYVNTGALQVTLDST